MGGILVTCIPGINDFEQHRCADIAFDHANLRMLGKHNRELEANTEHGDDFNVTASACPDAFSNQSITRPPERRNCLPQRFDNSSSCVTRIRVVCCDLFNSNIKSMTCAPVAASILPVGSSANSILDRKSVV